MQESYDVIVVGAGPAGSTAARFAALGGATVLLLEKDREVGIPVRCAEGISEAGLRQVVEPQPRWIANTITGVRLFAPDGRFVEVEDHTQRGFILDRKVFDYDLGQLAAQAGAEILTKAYVYDVLKEDGSVTGVKVQHLGQSHEVRAKIVIGADGVESRVGRWAGIRTLSKLKDMETCVQYTMSNIAVDPAFCYFYFGREYAPGGYLWIFPKSDTVANVGLGISGDEAIQRSPLSFLNQFVQKHFPKASVLTMTVGGVPCAATLKKIVANGLMLVGDAAHQVNPVSGGGIAQGMIAGKIAGRVAADAIREGDVSEQRLQQYAEEWQAAEGKTHERYYRIKEGIRKLNDDDLNSIADVLLRLPPEERTLFNIFKTALFKKPSLLVEVMKIFMG